MTSGDNNPHTATTGGGLLEHQHSCIQRKTLGVPTAVALLAQSAPNGLKKICSRDGRGCRRTCQLNPTKSQSCLQRLRLVDPLAAYIAATVACKTTIAAIGVADVA